MTDLIKTLRRARRSLEGAVVHDERGDVPGWVLITLMTAGLVAVLWKVAGDQLVALFQQAMSSVTG